MAYVNFYIYLILMCTAFLVINHIRPFSFRIIIIGVTTAAYSLTFDMLLGNWQGLYYYLDSKNSALYMVLSGIFIYPVVNMIYVLFLPKRLKYLLIYTAIWIVGMLLFEYVTVWQKIVIFTGWKVIPWSLVTYVFTYLWVNLMYGYVKRKIV